MILDQSRWSWTRGLSAVVIALCAYWLWGYTYGILTNEYHATLLLMDSGMFRFPGDFMASTLDGYASPLWSPLSGLVRIFPIRSVFFAGFIACRILLAFAIGSLASSMTSRTRDRKTAWIVGAIATLAIGWLQPLPVGSDPAFGAYFSQTFASFSLLLLAIAASLRRRLMVSALFLGLAIDCNIMQSFFGACIVGILWLGASQPWRKAELGRLGGAILVTVLLALPALLLTVHSFRNSTSCEAWTGQALSQWARFWLAGHYFIDGRSLARLLAMAALLLTPAVLLSCSPELRKRSTFLGAAMLVPAALALVEILLVDHFPSRLLFQFHLFRSDVFAYGLSVGCAVALVIQFRDRRPEAFIPALATLALILQGSHVLAILLGLFILTMCSKVNTRQRVVHLAFTLGAAAYCLWSFGTGERIACLVGLVGLAPYQTSGRARTHPIVATVLLVLLSLYSTFAFRHKEWIEGTSSLLQGDNSPVSRRLREFGANSPETAVFLLPPSVNARPYLQRGVWFNFYDGASFLWRKGAEVETARRMRILGIRYEPGKMVDLDSLDAQWFAGLCRSIPIVSSEGVTRIVLPDPTHPEIPWTVHDPGSAMKTLSCADASNLVRL